MASQALGTSVAIPVTRGVADSEQATPDTVVHQTSLPQGGQQVPDSAASMYPEVNRSSNIQGLGYSLTGGKRGLPMPLPY
jgi:hypothetical protein